MVDAGIGLFVGIMAFAIIVARVFGTFAVSATMRFSGCVLRLVCYGTLTYYFVQITMNKPVDAITFFTIVVCSIEVLVNLMNLILFIIEPFIKKKTSLDV